MQRNEIEYLMQRKKAIVHNIAMAEYKIAAAHKDVREGKQDLEGITERIRMLVKAETSYKYRNMI